MNKTTYCLLAVLAATLINFCLPLAVNLFGAIIICIALILLAFHLDGEASERD